MSRIREAAAAFIEAGRALGRYERARADLGYLSARAEACGATKDVHGELVARDMAAALEAAARHMAADMPALEAEAAEYQMAAERLVADLEDGLGRRVLRVIAAARAAWRQ